MDCLSKIDFFFELSEFYFWIDTCNRNKCHATHPHLYESCCFSCKAPAKRSQHANTTYRNIVGRNMLRAFGHHVAMCCNMLGAVGSSLKMVKFEPTTPNMSQRVATVWPNAHNMLGPTMLQYVASACCNRLAGV